MGKFGVFIAVLALHIFVLQAEVKKEHAISKPKAKVHRITLSSVVVKKPVVVPPAPIVEPIILPPDPEPIVEKVKPKKIKKVRKKPKKVRKKKVVKKRVKVKEPVIKELPPEPIVEQVIAPVVKVDTSSILDAYTSKIRREIRQNLIYPKMAKRMRMQGVVRVAFDVRKDGSIENIRVLNSPKKLLAKGAMKTLRSLSLPPIPSELNEEYLNIKIPIEFKLIR